jgi:hypothetical protein
MHSNESEHYPMRTDLNKVLCERERVGQTRKYRDVRHRRRFKHTRLEDAADLLHREGIRDRHEHRKCLNENLNPLIGLLRKNVRRPWNKIVHELHQVFKPTSVVNQHIYQHLNDFVAQTCVIGEDGDIYVNPTGWRRMAKLADRHDVRFYVHPTTGCLLENDHHKSYRQIRREHAEESKREAAKYVRVVEPGKIELRKRKDTDIWYVCDIAPVPIGAKVEFMGPDQRRVESPISVRDLWDSKWVIHPTSWRFRRYYSYDMSETYVTAVRSAPKKLIRKYVGGQ